MKKDGRGKEKGTEGKGGGRERKEEMEGRLESGEFCAVVKNSVNLIAFIEFHYAVETPLNHVVESSFQRPHETTRWIFNGQIVR